ncbi:DUF3168 domain-containing protein [Pseudomonas aeruginosa]|uniref:DUF3168 domain-containing protein n=1 Tax=Pseudomonas aeruginosa TaxID=287 RepID=UPI0029D4E572|nr:DUF3168 domain-containing protein [Pseudomonas aeruginosa]MDF5854813.1 DUF3168 domain-containing protein [Pseudomonas aeruginosa]MDF5857209.1 DUF3168 domain-containing protein [Pseudomonas aeruginosa]MDF5923163.1 DUF3168 domain-containing protein [Pseudomonas aeruginosa]HCL3594060.1 DUF3168 domain-containing protein [Pseudomonas aeruginosa]
MFPPIFEVCSASPEVAALLGSNPIRLFEFARATQSTPRPYATWASVAGSPENYLNQRPDLDRYVIQIDCWGSTSSQVRAVAQALRDAIEPVAYITAWRGEEVDADTALYRYSFDVDWLVQR